MINLNGRYAENYAASRISHSRLIAAYNFCRKGNLSTETALHEIYGTDDLSFRLIPQVRPDQPNARRERRPYANTKAPCHKRHFNYCLLEWVSLRLPSCTSGDYSTWVYSESYEHGLRRKFGSYPVFWKIKTISRTGGIHQP